MVAAVTYTAAGMASPPRAHAVGETTVVFSKSITQFHATVSSAVLLCKIPNKAIIFDAGYKSADATAAVTAALLELRVGSAAIGVTTSANQAVAGMNRATLLPLKVSLSDDAAVQYAVLSLNCTTAGTASTSLSLAGFVSYIMGDDAL